MLRMTFVGSKTLNPLEEEMVRFVNKNIVDIIDVLIDLVEDGVADGKLRFVFPRGYYEKYPERCIDILYSLRDRMNSSVLYEGLQPIYSYLLYHILEDWIDFNRDENDAAMLRVPLPSDLKNRILSDPEWKDEYEYEQTNGQEPFIINMLESVEEYIDNCFDDTDFLEEEIRAFVHLKKTTPILFDAMGINGELDDYTEVMPLDVLEDYKQIEKDAGIQRDDVQVYQDLMFISNTICNNSNYNEHSTENEVNDYYRDMLKVKGYFEVADQTRHGISAKGKDAGEVDLLLLRNHQEFAIVEGLKISFVDRTYIDQHINKAIINYNPLGTPTFILIYSVADEFDVVYKRLYEYLLVYDFPLESCKEMAELEPSNASVKALCVILKRNEIRFPVTFIVVNLYKRNGKSDGLSGAEPFVITIDYHTKYESRGMRDRPCSPVFVLM